eukprot:scaffold102442_cov54-Attheya_sp.AAC.3
MGKKVKKRGSSQGGGEAWSAAEHELRISTRMESLQKKCARDNTSIAERLQEKGYKRTALSHDSKDKRDADRLRLNITKTRRDVDKLRNRLTHWDDHEERQYQQARLAEEERKRKEREEEEEHGPKKKPRYRRPGPETWKLKGAARPAWQVYDFDVRYVDTHIEAHKSAKEKAKRERNILALFRGRLGVEESTGDDDDDDEGEDKDVPPQPHCREFLALLMQLGLLNAEGKKFKAAREALMECMDLDGTQQPITNARCRLMRMYLEANRPDSARRLWERLSPTDPSVWIRYSAALVEFVSWKLLNEPGSTRSTAETLLHQAIRSNIFCAFHIAYHPTFESVMEYTDEIEDSDEGTLEEAIEYCSSEQMGTWLGTEGAIEWLRRNVLRALNTNDSKPSSISKADLDWSTKLAVIEEEYEASHNFEDEQATDEEDNAPQLVVLEDDSEEEKHDLLMYAGMFRTAMDMLEDAGEFVKTVPESDESDANDDETTSQNLEEESIGAENDAADDPTSHENDDSSSGGSEDSSK